MHWVGGVPFMLGIWENVLIDMIWLDALFSLFLSVSYIMQTNSNIKNCALIRNFKCWQYMDAINIFISRGKVSLSAVLQEYH